MKVSRSRLKQLINEVLEEAQSKDPHQHLSDQGTREYRSELTRRLLVQLKNNDEEFRKYLGDAASVIAKGQPGTTDPKAVATGEVPRPGMQWSQTSPEKQKQLRAANKQLDKIMKSVHAYIRNSIGDGWWEPADMRAANPAGTHELDNEEKKATRMLRAVYARSVGKSMGQGKFVPPNAKNLKKAVYAITAPISDQEKETIFKTLSGATGGSMKESLLEDVLANLIEEEMRIIERRPRDVGFGGLRKDQPELAAAEPLPTIEKPAGIPPLYDIPAVAELSLDLLNELRYKKGRPSKKFREEIRMQQIGEIVVEIKSTLQEMGVLRKGRSTETVATEEPALATGVE